MWLNLRHIPLNTMLFTSEVLGIGGQNPPYISWVFCQAGHCGASRFLRCCGRLRFPQHDGKSGIPPSGMAEINNIAPKSPFRKRDVQACRIGISHPCCERLLEARHSPGSGLFGGQGQHHIGPAAENQVNADEQADDEQPRSGPLALDQDAQDEGDDPA